MSQEPILAESPARNTLNMYRGLSLGGGGVRICIYIYIYAYIHTCIYTDTHIHMSQIITHIHVDVYVNPSDMS